VIHEKSLHAQQATVWCGFWDGGVIGLYFFENEARNAVTVNGVCYRIIKNDLLCFFFYFAVNYGIIFWGNSSHSSIIFR
jgi:hypothetical protein